MGQMIDEADGVGQNHRRAIRRLQPAQGRVQGGEQLVGLEDAGLGEAVEEGRFAGIGVADQGHRRQLRLVPGPPALGPLTDDTLQPLVEGGDALAEQAAVGFELGLARPPQADTTLLALQVSPTPHEAGREMGELGQFHLELALERAGALGEDVQNEARAIQHPALEMPLQVALLARRQGMVEDDQFRLLGLHQHLQFVRLASTDKEPPVGGSAATADLAHDLGASGPGQQAKFLDLLGIRDTSQIQMNQDGLLSGARALEHGFSFWGKKKGSWSPGGCRAASPRARPPRPARDQVLPGSGISSARGEAMRTLRAGTTVEMACL